MMTEEMEEEDLFDVEAARRILAETKPDEWIPYEKRFIINAN